MADTDNPLVDKDSDITLNNYGHFDDGDWWGGWVTEGYGKDRDRYDQFWADGDENGEKPKVDGSGWFHGIPPADDGMALLSGIRESAHEVWGMVHGDFSDFSGVLDTLAAAVGVVSDGVGFLVDQPGTLLDWAVSWCLEHVTVLRMALDGLAGNPDVVAAYSSTWGNIADRFEQVGRQFASTALTGPGDWTGAAHDAYQNMAADVSTAIDSLAVLAKSMSVILAGVGQLVGGIRDLVKALISELAGLLVDGGEAAVGDEGQAAAGGIRAITDIVGKVLYVLARLAKLLDKLGPIIAVIKPILAAITSAWRTYGKK